MRARERLPYLLASAIALALLWQALALESWTFLGPGPGLFPQVTAGAATLLALLLACVPRLAASARGDDEPEPTLTGADRRRFLVYCLALPFLAFGAAFLGFVVTSLCLALALTWYAERCPWQRALAFGAICGVAGLIGFGRLLRATLPETAIEQTLLAWLR